ncbi:acyl carrier protein [Xylanibacter ruminicola]|uniref:Phosphopantetheine attachment site n=1 Tax=Xylanibacter ruminicola TaxID=839 RepID=A0A1M6R9E8_XYLRU|nr:acyl carrier protein [Xylanibacter ruminicola]SHK28948.1 Phosphopantetheine attachment site [Xylanibacter ruminicola]
MENLEKYNNAFAEVFGVNVEELNDDFGKDMVEEWDSVHQLSLISLLEESFDIMLDPEDIMELVSYGKGKQLLRKYGVEI